MNKDTFLHNKVTALLINYRTRNLSSISINNLQYFYPRINKLIIDNGSHDSSSSSFLELVKINNSFSMIQNDSNINHGPALDQGIKSISTPYILTIDSDCIIIRGGFLEKMLAKMSASNAYAAGKLIHINRFGYEIPHKKGSFTPYIQPFCMIIDKEKYLQLKPFIHHGSPGINNMYSAIKKGYQLIDFPIENYVYHIGHGTCGRFGYNLGIRHKIENILQNLINPKLKT